MSVPEAEKLASYLFDSSTLDILKGFENRQYQLNEVQCVLKLENCCVHVSRDMLTDEIKALHDDDHKSVVTLKLKADTYRDAWLCIGLISSKYFTSRETFDDIYSREWKYFDPDALQAVENFDKITLEDSLKMFSVKMWCNLDYYLSNITEIEKDLGHSLENVDISDESTKIHLEKKLLFKNSIDIFGDINDMEENTESTIFFRDFRILYKGYGRIYATARRGHHYLFFMYDE